MKSAILTIFLLTAMTIGCGGQVRTIGDSTPTWSVLQQTSIELPGNSGTVSFSNNVGQHNLIIVCLSVLFPNNQPVVTDSQGNSYQFARAELQRQPFSYIFYAQDTKPGPTVINITTDSPNNSFDAIVIELAGAALTNALDGTGGAEISAGQTHWAGGIPATSKPDDFIFDFMYSGSPSTPTDGTFIIGLNTSLGFLSTAYIVGNRIPTQENQFQLNWSQLSSNKPWIGLMAAFQKP